MSGKRFPLFVSLEGRRAVVIGGGTVGLRRAKVLRDFGADVAVISPRLAEETPGIHHIPRPYCPGDLAGAYLALAAADDPAVNAAAGEEARSLGVLFNRSDCPAECDFFFPAICEGGGMTAGLVGDGNDHKKTARTAREIRAVLGQKGHEMEITTRHPQETIIKSYVCKGIGVELVEWTQSLWCGKIGYAADNDGEPDVEKLMGDFMSAQSLGTAVKEREEGWDVCISLNYLSGERPSGVMFGFLVGSADQPDVFDMLKLPPARYMRLKICEETSKALGREPWTGGVPPYEWITEEIAPECGLRCGEDTLPVIEYYGYYDPEKNQHRFCYLYVPVQ